MKNTCGGNYFRLYMGVSSLIALRMVQELVEFLGRDVNFHPRDVKSRVSETQGVNSSGYLPFAPRNPLLLLASPREVSQDELRQWASLPHGFGLGWANGTLANDVSEGLKNTCSLVLFLCGSFWELGNHLHVNESRETAHLYHSR